MYYLQTFHEALRLCNLFFAWSLARLLIPPPKKFHQSTHHSVKLPLLINSHTWIECFSSYIQPCLRVQSSTLHQKAGIPVDIPKPQKPRACEPCWLLPVCMCRFYHATPMVSTRPKKSSCGLGIRSLLYSFPLPRAFAPCTFDRAHLRGEVTYWHQKWLGELFIFEQ